MMMELAGIGWAPDASGVILHLGAGHGEDLAALQALPAARIVLVEPNLDCHAALAGAARRDARIEILPAAICGAEDAPPRAPLHLRNITAQSSLRAPSATLRALFPALRETGAPDVDLLGIDALLDRLDLAPGGPALLVLDTPGEGGEILARLIATGAIERFGHLLLCLPQQALHEGETPAPDALAAAQRAGYRVLSQDLDDPDFPRYLLQRDADLADARKGLRDAQAQLAETRKALEAARVQATERQAALDARSTQLADMEKRAKTAEGAWGQRDAEAKALQAQKDARIAQLAEELTETRKALEAARVQATERQAALDARSTQLADMEKRAKTAEGAWGQRDAEAKALQAERDARIAQLTQDLTETRKALEAARAQATERQAALDARSTQLADMEKRAKTAEGAWGQRDAEAKALQAERDARIAQLAEELTETRKALEAARVQATERQAALDARSTQLADMEKRAKTAEGAWGQRDTEAKALQAEKDARIAELNAKLAALETGHAQTCKALEAAHDETRKRLEQKEMDVGVALRSQAASQSDLLDLRQRFEALRREKDAVDGLLMQVTSRLSAASNYLHVLASPETPPVSETPVPGAGGPALAPAQDAKRKKGAPGKARKGKAIR